MDCVSDFLLYVDLLLVPDARDIIIAAVLWRNNNTFSNKKSSRDGGALFIIIYRYRQRDVFVRGAEAGKGRECETVLKGNISYS